MPQVIDVDALARRLQQVRLAGLADAKVARVPRLVLGPALRSRAVAVEGLVSSSTSVRRPRTTMATWFHVESVSTWMALPTHDIAGPDEHNTRSPVRRASILTSTVAGYLLRFGPHRSYGAARFDNAATMALCVFESSCERTSPITDMRCTLAASIKSVAVGVLHGSRPVVV